MLGSGCGSFAFGSIRCLDIWRVRTNPAEAHAFMKTISGLCLVPEWMGLPVERAPICKGCEPKSPVLWDALLDEALGPRLQEWQGRGVGIYLHALTARPERTSPRSWGIGRVW